MLKKIVLNSLEKINNDIIAEKELYQTDKRHQFILQQLLSNNYFGNIVEIGCHEGLSTIMYLDYVSKCNHMVYALDPWDGRQEGSQGTYEIFCRNTQKFHQCLCMNRIDSAAPVCREILQDTNPIFALVDGLHTYDQVKKDIELVMSIGSKIICVDDVRGKYEFSYHLTEAVMENTNPDYELIWTSSNIKEAYFVRKEN